MKTCAYISGSPCVGKSTVAAAIQNAIPGIEYIRGDVFWREHSDLPFEERVAAVNRSLLAALQISHSSHILCEWPPVRGLFLSQLYDLCTSQDRRFLHVVLSAPVSVLRMRKRERDGDEDIGFEMAAILDEPKAYKRLIFDTTKDSPSCIADEIAKWILE